MYSDQSMEECIKTAIKLWAQSKKKPPFAEEQLFTMALLMTGEPMTEKEVFQWILDHVGYYRQLAVDCYYTSWPHWRTPHALDKASNEFRTNLSRVPQLFDLPLEVANIDNGGHRYSMSVANGERVLSQTLGLETSTQAFPFLRLPAELRDAVYEIVFRYPKSGLCFRSHHEKRKNVACVGTRSLNQTLDLESVNETKLLTTMPIKRILAPLLVNRQFYREAMPCFCNINNFYFPSHIIMHEILDITPFAHRNHIKHVTFTYQVMEPAGACAAITMLSKMGGLRKLAVHIDEKF